MASFGQRYADFFKEPGRAAAFTNVGAGLMAASGAGLTGAQRANLMMRGLGQANQASQADIERAQRQQQIDFQQEQAAKAQALRESNTLAGKRIANSMLMGGEEGMMGPTQGAASQMGLMSPADRATREYAAATGEMGPMFTQMGRKPLAEPASVQAARAAMADPALAAQMKALKGGTTVNVGTRSPLGKLYADLESLDEAGVAPDAPVRQALEREIADAGRPSGEAMGRREMMKSGQRTMNDVMTNIRPGGEWNNKLLAEMASRFPGSEGRLVRGQMDEAMDFILRAETGAAATTDEVKRNTKKYLPSVLDSDEGKQDKLERLQRRFDNARAVMEGKETVTDLGDFGTMDANALVGVDPSGMNEAQLDQLNRALEQALGR